MQQTKTVYGKVLKVNDSWFAYAEERILGPFKFEKQALRALSEESNE